MSELAIVCCRVFSLSLSACTSLSAHLMVFSDFHSLSLSHRISVNVCVLFMWLRLLFFRRFILTLVHFLCHFPFGSIFTLVIALLSIPKSSGSALISAVSSARMQPPAAQKPSNHSFTSSRKKNESKKRGMAAESNVIIKYLSFRTFSNFQFLIVHFFLYTNPHFLSPVCLAPCNVCIFIFTPQR